jgi:IS6 family transposase
MHSGSAFSGYRFPPEVILTALRWYFSYALSAQQVMELLAERGMDVSRRTILRWAQTFGPLLGQAVRRRRVPFGQRWFVDEVFVHIGGVQQYLYRMIDEAGHVVDVLLREHRDTASAEAFFRRTKERTASLPDEVVSDYHQPYIKALSHTWPDVQHRRSGLHRARGITTKPVERSHIPTRDRLRNSRGLKTIATAQRFLEGFEALYALRHGHVAGVPVGGSVHERVRQVTTAFLQLGRHLRRAG